MRTDKRRVSLMRILSAALGLLVFAACAVVGSLPFLRYTPALALPAREEGALRIHFLGVGQADCTVVEFPDGDALVVDAGDGTFASDTFICRYIAGLGSPALTLVATHADLDHIGGFPALIRTFGAQAIYMPLYADDTSSYRAFAAAAEGAGCPVSVLTRYGVIARPSGAYVACVSPRSEEDAEENDTSAVLYIAYGGVSALLCGDISGTRERMLLSESLLAEDIFDCGEYPVRLNGTDILKVSHHGSKDASDPAWLSYLGARAAVLSCGRGNSYGHPAGSALCSLLGSGCTVYRTDELGSVCFTIKEGGFTVRTEIGL